ncbi:MAG: DUF1552 domain-containing protein [Planctomycetota bacterium]|nr:DUF1552 domain-containing protein [Planctomycetota bacterium]
MSQKRRVEKTCRSSFSARQLHRRAVLRGAGVTMSLPWLTAMQRAVAMPAMRKETPAKRFVAMTLTLGLHGPNLVPEGEGLDYKPSMYLEDVQDLRDKLTVVSGSSHPGVNGGHRAEASLLTAARQGGGRARNTISIDQLLAKHFGNKTRFPSLVLAAEGSNSPSYTENGAMIPAQSSPSRLYMDLFVDDSPAVREIQARRIVEGRSIMDLVAEDARSLQRTLGISDQDRLDAYFTSVRDLEKRMAENEKWARMPKPKVDEKKPVDIADPSDLIARQRAMHDVIRLALKTDSTRFITFHTGGGGGVIPIAGIDESYHTLSHHGMDEEKLQQLGKIERAMVNQWADFLRDIATIEEEDSNLLDNTAVLLTSNLGNASNHSNRNMPVLLAGGGFKHAGHLAFDQNNNYPLPNLFVSVLQQCGLEVDKFATSTSTMTGLS